MEDIELRIQATLDDLFDAHLIPFALTAYEVSADGASEYVISFHDSRIRTCIFSWKGQEDFEEVVRTAVLERVKRMSSAYEEYCRSSSLSWEPDFLTRQT